ncbi:hypothetical protein J1N35_028166 [Gossypium stocksii]|uniref:Uncharacterized protein n=1 Tax=Gossypium stocksii TaxID=47602 RepID=A0A9D3UW67_9ROSI|nr:hypothetical protein J1N35_028166 [Gossypium stocksii]
MVRQEDTSFKVLGVSNSGFKSFWWGVIPRFRQIVDITAIHGVSRALIHVRTVRRKGCVNESNPSPHGGRGALPSEGGSPSDLLFLAGGGIVF